MFWVPATRILKLLAMRAVQRERLVPLILGDPGAVTGGGKKSKQVRKKFGRRKVKNEEKSRGSPRMGSSETPCLLLIDKGSFN